VCTCALLCRQKSPDLILTTNLPHFYGGDFTVGIRAKSWLSTYLETLKATTTQNYKIHATPIPIKIYIRFLIIIYFSILHFNT
jgi:hypothetical protein